MKMHINICSKRVNLQLHSREQSESTMQGTNG